jgi:hypothetical protein
MSSQNNLDSFIKTDSGRFVNSKFIRWIQEVEGCYHICSKMDGCVLRDNTFSVCKQNPSFNRLKEILETNTST